MLNWGLNMTLARWCENLLDLLYHEHFGDSKKSLNFFLDFWEKPVFEIFMLIGFFKERILLFYSEAYIGPSQTHMNEFFLKYFFPKKNFIIKV